MYIHIFCIIQWNENGNWDTQFTTNSMGVNRGGDGEYVPPQFSGGRGHINPPPPPPTHTHNFGVVWLLIEMRTLFFRWALRHCEPFSSLFLFFIFLFHCACQRGRWSTMDTSGLLLFNPNILRSENSRSSSSPPPPPPPPSAFSGLVQFLRLPQWFGWDWRPDAKFVFLEPSFDIWLKPWCTCIQWKLVIKRSDYNKISDVTNCFLRSQLNNFLCFVLFIENWYNKISDITNKISWSQGSCYKYRVSPVVLYNVYQT